MAGDATDLAEALRSGRTTATKLMEASLAAASLWAERDLGAICHLAAESGLARAAAFDALPAAAPERAAPFAGLPMLVKDLGAPFAGLQASGGSALFPRHSSGEASDLSQRFDVAGLIPFGLTTSPEFGLSLSSEPAIGPNSRNPLDLTLSSGGSSGGAAAAVAAGIVPIAHATDAGGSIRVPAACCGLYGLKPSRGAIPAGPAFGNHLGGIASELVVARSARDLSTAFTTIAGGATFGPYAPVAFAKKPPRPLRLLLLSHSGSEQPTAPDRQAAVTAAAEQLASLGHKVKSLDWAVLETISRESNAAFADIVSINLAAWFESAALDITRVEPITAAAVERGKRLGAIALWQRLSAMPGVSHALARLFQEADALILPMLAQAPLPLGAFPMDHDDIELHFRRMADFAPLAALANISGNPALTLPFGADARGLPLPVQILGPMGGEPLLLDLAAQLEAAGNWHRPFALAGFA